MKNSRALRWLTFAVLMLSLSAASFAQIAVGFSVRIGPPALPVYTQPVCPGPGYLWTPGYWSWDDADGYYWVPGTWVVAPVGLLWTPGYWGWGDGLYVWHAGYWGPHVGFYGGINYGFGYTGAGFFGGEWRGGAFFYNRSVMNVNVTRITNVYERTVVVNNNHVAFNGGEGGVEARPTAEEERYASEKHTPPIAAQVRQEHLASQNKALFARENHGRPAIAATGKPGDFKGHDVVAAREAGGEYHEPKMSPREASAKAGENRGTENRGAENRASEPRNENRQAARPENRENKPAENRENKPAENREKNTQSRQEKSQQQHEQQAARQNKAPKPQAEKPQRQEPKQQAEKPQRQEPKQQAEKPQRQETKPQAKQPKPERKPAPSKEPREEHKKER
ncbi:MAG: hypothetical protein WBS24_10195 [Terriglobales bacterium]